MSEESYQLNCLRGVTGSSTATCLPASFDRISRTSRVNPDTYAQYNSLRWQFVSEFGDDTKYIPNTFVERKERVMTRLLGELGVHSRGTYYARVREVADLASRLSKLSHGGFRHVVYLRCGGLHAVGLMPKPGSTDSYIARSTWTPFADNDDVCAEEMINGLDQPPRLRRGEGSSKTYTLCNLFAIPPEPRKKRIW